MRKRTDETMSEHRTSLRIRSFLRGEVIHSGGASRTECIVRDLSELGARVEVPASVTIPEFFDLAVPQRHLMHRSRIIWRHGNELGIAFADLKRPAEPATAEEMPLDLKIRMLELEAETARLRLQLAEMKAVIEGMVHETKKTA